MSKSPSFNFYSSDFLTGTVLFSYEQLGKYIKLLCLQHQQGHLSKEDMLLICGEEDSRIFGKFKVDNEGLYYNERLDIEINKKVNWVESRRANLSKCKSTHHMGTHMNTHMASHMEYEYEIENRKEEDLEKEEVQEGEERPSKRPKPPPPDFQADFDEFWEVYPQKKSKKQAMTAYANARKQHKTLTNADLLPAVRDYIADCERTGCPYAYASTWLNGERWNDAPSVVVSQPVRCGKPAREPPKTAQQLKSERIRKQFCELNGIDYQEFLDKKNGVVEIC